MPLKVEIPDRADTNWTLVLPGWHQEHDVASVVRELNLKGYRTLFADLPPLRDNGACACGECDFTIIFDEGIRYSQVQGLLELFPQALIGRI